MDIKKGDCFVKVNKWTTNKTTRQTVILVYSSYEKIKIFGNTLQYYYQPIPQFGFANEITEDADWERFARKYLEIWRRMRLLKNSFYLFFFFFNKHHSSLVRERIFSVLSTMLQWVVLELHNTRAGNNCVTADRKNKCIFIPWRTVPLMTAFLPISRPSLYKVKN